MTINDRDEANAKKAADEIMAKGGRMMPFAADATNKQSLNSLWSRFYNFQLAAKGAGSLPSRYLKRL